MLSAAGVRMDAEKETLLQTTLSLQDQLKESQVALLVEQVCHFYVFYVVLRAVPIGSIGQSLVD